jgi:hypothetical protein
MQIVKYSAKYFSYLLITYIFVIFYILPYGSGVNHAVLFLPVALYIVALMTLLGGARLNTNSILIYMMISIVIVFPSQNKIIYTIFAIISYYLSQNKVEVGDRYSTFLFYMATLGIISQLLMYKSVHNRPVLSMIDPNVSGAYMLPYFFYSVKLNRKVGILISLVCVFLFLSRNYFIAISIFFIIRWLKPYIQWLSRPKAIIVTFILSNLLIFVISYQWVEMGRGEGVLYTSESSRLFSIADNSNFSRFTVNAYYLDLIINEFSSFLFVPDDFSLENEYITRYPHESILYLIIHVGIVFSILYLALMWNIIKKNGLFDHYEYIISYLIFSLFIFTGFSPLILTMTLLVIAMDTNTDQKKNNKQP